MIRKTVRLGDIFTQRDFDKAAEILRDEAHPIDRLVKEVVDPKMQRINVLTQQENSSRYFAYLLQYALGTHHKRGSRHSHH